MPGFGGSGLVGGAGQAVSSLIQVLDDPLLNLVSIDVLGFIIPRSLIELKSRGWDAFRETSIRETTGMLFNVFVVGWLGLVAHTLYTRNGVTSPVLNPKGLPLDGHLPLLKEIAYRFDGALDTATDTHNAVEKLARSLVDDLSPIDDQLMAQLGARPSPEAEREGREQLIAFLSRVSDNAGEGHYPFASRVQRKLGQWREALQSQPETFAEAMLAEQQQLKPVIESRLDEAMQLARRAGLYERVRLTERRQTGNPNSELHDLRLILRDFTGFVSHFADRAATEAGLAQGLLKKVSLTDTLKHAIREKLSGGVLPHPVNPAGWFPRAEDSLMIYLQKSKRGLVLVPMLLTILGGGAIAFINNAITRRKHHGVTFFPGELTPEQALAQALRGATVTPHYPVPIPSHPEVMPAPLPQVAGAPTLTLLAPFFEWEQGPTATSPHLVNRYVRGVDARGVIA